MNGSRQSPKAGFDDRAGVDRSIDPGHDIVPHDHAQFAPAAIHSLAFDVRFYVALVMAQIGADGSCPEVAPLSDNAVSHVGEVPDLAAAHDGAVFDLHRVSYPDFVAQAGAGPDVAVGSDVAVLSDHNRAHDVGSGANDAAPAHGYIAQQNRAGLNLAQHLRLLGL